MDTPVTNASDVPAAPEQDEHVRTRLLNAAVHVFDRKGYASAAVREIAELAGVTKPALYYHFGSKEGVLMAILTQARLQFTQALEQAVVRTGSARDRITALCEDVYGLFEQNVPVARVAHAVLFGPPEMAPPFDLTAFELLFRQAIERIAADGQATGEFRPGSTTDIALAVMGIIEGCNERQLHQAFDPVGVAGVRRLLDLLFDGVTSAQRA
ncbi:MAG: TetR/AcrR family transcriptional regulator [Acidobacteria bacterium]|nr:TetR/AcrR family transcriptional regulator [Acidobacteriota bacterium]